MNDEQIHWIALDQIELGENIRATFDENELKGLALSIRENGMLIPLELVPGETKPYRVFDGARRYAAAELLKLSSVPARIRDRRPSEGERLQQQIVINAQRAEPRPTELAQAINGYMETTGSDASQAARKFGFSNAKVSRYRKLLRLEDWIQELVDNGQLALTTAGSLADLEDPEQRTELARQAASGHLTRARAGTAVRQEQNGHVSLDGSARPRASVRLSEELTFRGEQMTLDGLVDCLHRALARARKAQRQGLDLAGFVKLVNSESRSKVMT